MLSEAPENSGDESSTIAAHQKLEYDTLKADWIGGVEGLDSTITSK
jgi:hypothetical protein